MYIPRRLPHLFILVVVCAVIVFAMHAVQEPPSTGKTLIGLTPVGWQPSVWGIVFWCVLLAAVAATPWYPCLGLAAYLLTEYSCYRYGPELEFVYMTGLTELVSIGAAVGTAIWWLRNPKQRTPINDRLAGLLLGLVTWAAVSALAAAIRHGHWQFEPQHHPVRYMNALLLFGVAAVGLRKPLDMLVITGALYVAIAWRAIQFPQANHLDGDLGGLAAIVLPLAIGLLLSSPQLAIRITAALAAAHIGWLLIGVQSRGAIVATMAGLFVLWLRSSFRWMFLLLAAPAILGALYIGYHNGLYERVRGSLPGGSTYSSVQSRFALWELAWQTAKAHPLLGIGPGEFAEERRSKTGGSAKVAHNNFLSILAELGFPGFILYTLLFGSALISLLRIGHDHGRWEPDAAHSVAGALTAYLAGGMFMTRQDQALAYILLGSATAILSAKKLRHSVVTEVV